MDAQGNKNWYDDIDKRWTAIGELIEMMGHPDHKMAWMLCRGDAANWRLHGEQLEKQLNQPKEKLRISGYDLIRFNKIVNAAEELDNSIRQKTGRSANLFLVNVRSCEFTINENRIHAWISSGTSIYGMYNWQFQSDSFDGILRQLKDQVIIEAGIELKKERI